MRKSHKNQLVFIHDAKKAINELISLWNEGKTPRCIEILRSVAKSKLFIIPDELYTFTNIDEDEFVELKEIDSIEDEDMENIKAWCEVLEAPFDQIRNYNAYVSGLSCFATHQGVKGLEFERVMISIDDNESRGFMFSYDKLFGVENKTATDLRNENEGRETSIDRTRRLFYVGCSRAKKSLAIIAFTKDPEKLKENVIIREWFEESEVKILSLKKEIVKSL